MKTYIPFSIIMLATISLLNNGCKKNENIRRTTTYQLDSIEIIQINNSGDTLMRFALGLAPNYIDSFMSFQPFYRFNGDSIIYNSFENPYEQGFNYSKHLALNNKLVSVISNYDHTHYDRIFTSVYRYSSNGNIDSVNTDMFYFDSGPEAEFNLSRKMNYTGGNITSITETLHSIFHDYPGGDSINDKNVVPTTFSYIHNYPSQKDMIGLDVNEIIFDMYRCLYLKNYPSGYGITYNAYSIGLIQVLVLCDKIRFNTNCSNLIEKIDFDPIYSISATGAIGGGVVYYSAYTSERLSLHINYTFDSANNNRITQMVAETQPSNYSSLIQFGKVIFRFKYAH